MQDVTITVLTRDGGRFAKRLILALQSQRTQRRVSYLIVESGSRDDTLKLWRAAGARVASIAPGAFNFGATRDYSFQQTDTPLVVTLSQDAIPAREDWLENLLAPLEADSAVGASCGASRPDAQRGYGQFAWERNGCFYFTAEMQRYRRTWGRGLSFSNAAIRRTAWEQSRIAPITLGEDFQFQQKMLAQGWQVAFPDGAEVLHHHDYRVATLWRRCRNEGAALEQLGCSYDRRDLFHDLTRPAMYKQWLREVGRGAWRHPAAALFPWLRPLAVYTGSRRARVDVQCHNNSVTPFAPAPDEASR